METLIQKLRMHHLSVTPQRLAVLSWLEERRDHPTAEQIFQAVRQQLPAISFNTIYKTLEALCDRGLIIKVNPLHEVARYDIRTHNHAHLICRRCQVIVDLEGDPLLVPPNLPQEALQGFKVENHSVIFWGLCPSCHNTIHSKEEEH
jgi:Fur family peroxide stress response transcriptional regulator